MLRGGGLGVGFDFGLNGVKLCNSRYQKHGILLFSNARDVKLIIPDDLEKGSDKNERPLYIL